MSRPTPLETYVIDHYGPCIVAQVCKTDPGTCCVLTWKGEAVYCYDTQLHTFPTRVSGSVRIPDLRVEGVAQITDLFVDLIEALGRRDYRAKSPLYMKFNKLERDGFLDPSEG